MDRNIMNTTIHNLKMHHITKRFPGILALDDVSIEVNAGQVLALVGENGAGKTTLMNVLMGLYKSDEGRISINDETVSFQSPSDAYSHGIGMVHQRYMLVPNLTVTENIALGYRHTVHRLRLDLDTVRSRIDEVSSKYGLSVDPNAYIWQLSVGEQQKVELVKALCLGAKLMILDEPTSALTPQEIDELIDLLRVMKKEIPLIFISHKLKEVKELSDDFAVLRHGKIVYQGNTCDCDIAQMASLMTGHEVKLARNSEKKHATAPALILKDLNVRSDRGFLALNGFNLTINRGEIMGLAGVSGNGQKELAQVINGLRKAESGSIVLLGKELLGLTPGQIIEKGMGYIPEDRNTEGIVPSFSIKENLILKDADSSLFSSHHLLNHHIVEENADKLVGNYDIRCAGTSISAGSLSGGNIQKVILARELTRAPKFLIAVYPTRGLDLGAAEFIHDRLLEIRKKGTGILLISEELDEIMRLSDRISVIFKGQIQGILDAKTATRKQIGLLMAGVKN
jgi:simple sugar transport system ATP-binding protein